MFVNRSWGQRGGQIAAVLLALGASTMSIADSAAVLPQGVARGYLDFYRYQPTTQRYNADGKREDLAFPFTDAALDSNVLPSLAPLDPLVGGTATIGDVSVAYAYDIDVLDLGYSYGLTDRLSIGFHVPYYWITNSVTTALDNSTANVGLDPATGDCCIPGGTPMEIDDVQKLIMDQYGFGRIDRWRRDGIGDIEIGGKYRFFLREDSAFAATGGLRIPTGYEDDADQLDDVAWSYGNYALLLRLHYDYLLSKLWNDKTSALDPLAPAPGDTVVNLTFRYDYMLPDEKTMRIGDTPEQVLTGNRERVSRKLGDLVNIELAATYHATDALALAAVYTYGFKAKDDIDGSRGFNYASLEADTDSSEQIIIVELTYSTLAAYRRQQRAAPMEFSVAYRDRFEGKGPRSGQANPKLDTSWFVAGMSLLF